MRYYERYLIKHTGKIENEYPQAIVNSIKYGVAYSEGVYLPINGNVEEVHNIYRHFCDYSFEDDLNRNLRGVQNIKTLWTF